MRQPAGDPGETGDEHEIKVGDDESGEAQEDCSDIPDPHRDSHGVAVPFSLPQQRLDDTPPVHREDRQKIEQQKHEVDPMNDAQDLMGEGTHDHRLVQRTKRIERIRQRHAHPDPGEQAEHEADHDEKENVDHRPADDGDEMRLPAVRWTAIRQAAQRPHQYFVGGSPGPSTRQAMAEFMNEHDHEQAHQQDHLQLEIQRNRLLGVHVLPQRLAQSDDDEQQKDDVDPDVDARDAADEQRP